MRTHVRGTAHHISWNSMQRHRVSRDNSVSAPANYSRKPNNSPASMVQGADTSCLKRNNRRSRRFLDAGIFGGLCRAPHFTTLRLWSARFRAAPRSAPVHCRDMIGARQREPALSRATLCAPVAQHAVTSNPTSDRPHANVPRCLIRSHAPGAGSGYFGSNGRRFDSGRAWAPRASAHVAQR